jgi:replication initiation and membrane attachment protein DnaB
MKKFVEVLTPDVYRTCYEFAFMKCRGRIHPNYLKTICEDVLKQGIETEEEARNYFRNWMAHSKAGKKPWEKKGINYGSKSKH